MDIRAIEDHGYTLTVENPSAREAEVIAAAMECVLSRVAVRLRFESEKGIVTVTGSLSAAGISTCVRCGADTEVVVEGPVALTYVKEPEETGESRELTEEEMDLGWYSEGTLEPLDVLSEAVALALPDRLVCVDSLACEARAQALLAAQDAGPEPEIGLKALGKLHFSS
ncbi:MAG: DUF177 domain-containing protein [Deltaproteobacteria bacterium]|nr:DUF177 domain-containing protein [Deltaproteobacteria bacterium]